MDKYGLFELIENPLENRILLYSTDEYFLMSLVRELRSECVCESTEDHFDHCGHIDLKIYESAEREKAMLYAKAFICNKGWEPMQIATTHLVVYYFRKKYD